MERIQITIRTANAAFAEAPATEIARILKTLAQNLEDGHVDSLPLHDFNGNNVGSFDVFEDE